MLGRLAYICWLREVCFEAAGIEQSAAMVIEERNQ